MPPALPVSLLLFGLAVLAGPLAVRLARRRIRGQAERLRGSLPPEALRVREGAGTRVPLRDLKAGDLLRVSAGEVVPADGTVESGFARIDESPLTGPGLPVEREAGDPLLAGFRCMDGTLEFRVERSGEDTRLAALLDRLLQVSEGLRGSPGLALGLGALLWAGVLLAWGLSGGGALLPLLISVNPAVLPAAALLPDLLLMALSLRQGVFWKGGAEVRRAALAREIWFEEGALLTGQRHVLWFWAAPGQEYGTTLVQAASAERNCPHPIARAVVKQAVGYGGNLEIPSAVEEAPGKGRTARLAAGEVRVGSPAFLREHGVDLAPLAERIAAQEAQGVDLACVARDGKAVGLFALERVPRPDASQAVRKALALGFRVGLLSRDTPVRAALLARTVGIPEGCVAPAPPVGGFRVGWGGGPADASAGAALHPMEAGASVLGMDLRGLGWLLQAAGAARRAATLALSLGAGLGGASLGLAAALRLGPLPAAGLCAASTALALAAALGVLWSVPASMEE